MKQYPTDPLGQEDKGDVVAPKPCAAKIHFGGWCFLEDGHDGMCVGPSARDLPVSDFMPRSRK